MIEWSCVMVDEMKVFEGKTCHIQVDREGKTLFFTGGVRWVNTSHIGFVDKFNNECCFKISNVQEIRSL
jgi:hypothetical protein